MSGIKAALSLFLNSSLLAFIFVRERQLPNSMTTTTLPTPPTIPRRSLRTAGKTNKVWDASEKNERQEKQQPSLNTMSTTLDFRGARRSRGSVTITRNKKGSGKDPMIGIVCDSKAHENVSRTSNDEDDDGRRETLASGGKNFEISKNRNLSIMEVDPAFVVLSPTAQEFLQAQGITSALTFMAINANDLAPAWIEWNEGTLKTKKATMDLQCWKRRVQHQWSSSSTKEGATPLSNHVAGALLSQRPVAEEVAPTVEAVPALRFLESAPPSSYVTEAVLKQSSDAEVEAPTVEVVPALRSLESAPPSNHVAEAVLKQSSVAEAEAPTVEVVPALRFLESEAREFLFTQGIRTAEAFLSTKTGAMADALMDWRARSKKEPLSLVTVKNRINKWKRSVREHQSSMSGEPLVELDADLKTLSSMARHFLSSQGIATVETFLLTKSATMVNAMMDWRNQWDSGENSIKMARDRICRWKTSVRVLQSSRQDASGALVPELDVLSPTGQPFLSMQSISRQSDLFRKGFQPSAGPSNIGAWQQAELQEHKAGAETMHGAPSRRVSVTPPVVNARSSLLHQEPDRLGTGNTGTQGIDSPGQDGTNQTHTKLGAATGTHCYQVVTRTFPYTLPAVVNETAAGKAVEDVNASNDCSSQQQHGDSKGAEPRDDSNEQKPGSKRKRS
jgi:hypothetical protein